MMHWNNFHYSNAALRVYAYDRHIGGGGQAETCRLKYIRSDANRARRMVVKIPNNRGHGPEDAKK